MPKFCYVDVGRLEQQAQNDVHVKHVEEGDNYDECFSIHLSSATRQRGDGGGEEEGLPSVEKDFVG